MTPEEFRELLKESVVLEAALEWHHDYVMLVVTLRSTDAPYEAVLQTKMEMPS